MSVCLLITTYNRSPLLRQSLARLTELTVPDEVLVVDDGGSDGCEGVVRVFEGCLPIRYLYTHNPGEAMCSHARNVGLHATDCEVVITSEPEIRFDTDVVRQMLTRHESDRAQLFPPLKQFINAGVVYTEHPDGGGKDKHVNWQALWVALYRREWLLAVGGWDEKFPQPWSWDDVDLGTRLRIAGVGQYNDMTIEATHAWHPPRVYDQEPTEAYYAAKGFNGNESPDHPLLVANRDDPNWGVPIPRP